MTVGHSSDAAPDDEQLDPRYLASGSILAMAFAVSDAVKTWSAWVTAGAGVGFISSMASGESIAKHLSADVLAWWMYTCVFTIALGAISKYFGMQVQAARSVHEAMLKDLELHRRKPVTTIDPLPSSIRSLLLPAVGWEDRWSTEDVLKLNRYEAALYVARRATWQKRFAWGQFVVILFSGAYVAGLISGHLGWHS